MLLSGFKRNSRELSIEYLNSPELGGVCEVSSKEREGPPSFRLKCHIFIHDTKAIILNRPGSATTPCCKRKQQVRRCFYFYPFALHVAVFSFFAIRRSFACCEGALAATAMTAAAAAVCCSVSLIVSVLCVMFCLLCCLICVILGVLLCYYSCDI